MINVLVPYSYCSLQRAFTILRWYPSHGRHAEHRFKKKEQDTSLCSLQILLNVTWVESKPLHRVTSTSIWYWHLRCSRHHHFFIGCIFMLKPPLTLILGCTISFWTFKCEYLKEESTSSFMRQAKSQNNWGWQGYPSLFCACLSSGPGSCSKQAP